MAGVYFVTLSRSDYASTRPVLRAALHAGIDAKLIAGGSHLLKRYGNTIEQIRDADGFSVHATPDFLRETDDSPAELAAAYARAVEQFVRIFTEGKPERIFIVGDRWEMLAVASAASLLQIPIIHHSGGDITQGSADNQTRYALTTLSHLHLTALPEHSERLIALGEEPWRVTTVGEPALTELAANAKAVPDIHAHLGLKKGEPFVLATFHPTSFDTLAPDAQIDVFLNALDAITDTIILTAPNPDAASDVFLRKLKDYAAQHAHVHLHDSLGSAYYAAMNAARFMIGNSSSGLWEAPSFALPVINIGPRQQGRVHGSNAVNVALDADAIRGAIATVSAPSFRAALTIDNPYVRTDTLELIVRAITQPTDAATLLAKRFIDPLGK